MIAKVQNYIDEVKVELRKVTWPTRKETIATTWVVLVVILVISMYLGLCDFILTKLMRFMLR